MKRIALLLLFVFVLVAIGPGCAKDVCVVEVVDRGTDAGQEAKGERSETDAGQDAEGETSDRDAGGTGGEASLAAPDAPTVTVPETDQQISSPEVVAGTGEPGAFVEIKILERGIEIGTAFGTVHASGDFILNVNYDDPGPGLAMTVSVKQTNQAGTSAAATVAVNQLVPPPTVQMPKTDHEVFSPVRVTGTGLAEASIEVRILDNEIPIGNQSGIADGSGAFDLEVSYPDADVGTVLEVRVTQTVEGVTSDVAGVEVVQK